MKPTTVVLMSGYSNIGLEVVTTLCVNGYIPSFVIQLEENKLKQLRWFWKIYGEKLFPPFLIDAFKRNLVYFLKSNKNNILYRGRDVFKKYNIRHLNTRNLYSLEVAKLLKETAPDFILAPAVGIIKKNILLSAKVGVLNIHVGILPEFRGNDPIYWTSKNNGEFGVTVHLMDEGIDTGPIIVQKKIRPQNESIEEFKKHLFLEGLKEVIEIFNKYSISGNVEALPQGKGNYYKTMPYREKIEIAKKFCQFADMSH